jgi:hypothetical protein
MDDFIGWLHEKRHLPKQVRVSGDVAPKFADIIELLNRHSTPELPLVDLFVLALQGEGPRAVQRRLGPATFHLCWKSIIQIIDKYAKDTGDWAAMRFVARMRDPEATRKSPNCPDCAESSRMSFGDWLLEEERSLVDPHVLDGYERLFQQQLEALIQRTRDPALRQAFENMRFCPVQTGQGRCCRFIDYVLGTLIRHGVTQQYDLEDALQRIVFWMLSPVGERGGPKKSLFDFDESRPYDLKIGNPLQAIFRKYLVNAVRTVAMGKIPALRRVQYPNRLSINYGRSGNDPAAYGTVAAEEIPGRVPSYDFEMLNDLMDLLRRQSTPEMHLDDLFMSILRGEGTRFQRSRFGHSAADAGRRKIVQTISMYSRQTHNWSLLHLIDRVQNPDAVPARQQQSAPRPPKPTFPPDEQDYRSIVDVLEKNNRSVSMAVLGKVRRRWLERPPRDPSSQHPNRLADVLARMVADGVLAKQGTRYVPAANYARYVGTPEPAGV